MTLNCRACSRIDGYSSSSHFPHRGRNLFVRSSHRLLRGQTPGSRRSQSRNPLSADAAGASQRKKEALAERVEKQSRVRILEAIRKKLPDAFSRPDLEIVALDYFRRLGHDNHRRVFKLYAWEEKKSKTSLGAETVDYEKIAAAAVKAMKPADLSRLLVVCALVSDLYCPGYNPRQSLEKTSNLAQAASRYKVDAAKIVTAVRVALSTKNTERQYAQTTTKKAGKNAKSEHRK